MAKQEILDRDERDNLDNLWILTIISIVLNPIVLLVYLIIYGLMRIKLRRDTSILILLATGAITILLYCLFLKSFPYQEIPLISVAINLPHIVTGVDGLVPDIWNAIKHAYLTFSWLTTGGVFLIQSVGLMSQPTTPEEQIKEKKKKESKAHVHSVPSSKALNFKNNDNVFAIGTTGSGKTANILQYVNDNIKNNGFSVVVDGKGGIGPYDLATVTRKLAKKYDKKIYVLNMTDENDTDRYNPFSDLTATQVKTMLVNMSEWESDHYRTQASRYWQEMVRILQKIGTPITFQSIIDFSNPENFSELLLESLNNGVITQEEYEKSKAIADQNGEQAKISIARTADVAEGDGQKFLGGSDGFSIRQAYKENASVIFLINELRYKEFAKSIGKLALEEMSILISDLQKLQSRGQLDEKQKKLFVLEELGAYVDDGMEGLLNRGRSTGIKTICSAQTLADIDKVSTDLKRQIMGNCKDFLVMRTTDPESAEELSNIIGTEETIEKTYRTEEGIGTGQSSNKLIDTFKVHPNDIKNLPDRYGFYFSKSNGEIKRIKTSFVRV